MNLVDRFFADITQECVRAGSFRSVPQLTRAIEAYMAVRNEEPKPYRWKADGAKILAKDPAREGGLGGCRSHLNLFEAQDTRPRDGTLRS